MKNIDKLTKQYSLSKTLKFSLIPIGKTLENYESKDGLTIDDNEWFSYIQNIV